LNPWRDKLYKLLSLSDQVVAIGTFLSQDESDVLNDLASNESKGNESFTWKLKEQ